MWSDDIKKLKEAIESIRNEVSRAEREGGIGKTAELKYGKLPEAEKRMHLSSFVSVYGE